MWSQRSRSSEKTLTRYFVITRRADGYTLYVLLWFHLSLHFLENAKKILSTLLVLEAWRSQCPAGLLLHCLQILEKQWTCMESNERDEPSPRHHSSLKTLKHGNTVIMWTRILYWATAQSNGMVYSSVHSSLTASETMGPDDDRSAEGYMEFGNDSSRTAKSKLGIFLITCCVTNN